MMTMGRLFVNAAVEPLAISKERLVYAPPNTANKSNFACRPIFEKLPTVRAETKQPLAPQPLLHIFVRVLVEME